ncbi:leucyl aminopeptidase [Candidatus Kaiserbacteria bacterium CG10_big_fil_rev_8_21_14_0_10_45_20]|uniref:Probable cytosol aminopeptidase n=1 Tax=Candidatus Kaiserbacteria bacterium CG10_big_fil_rev_8_21_14_0_10_45_20 TaxID=1974607 RepID=A0A2H0UGH4_9BACT|nr:MAG: leucyl aminopeptidase [Candidatus Kaiserbacteria bacterium CG10_big_fil_rev_8_21_14_0_10_45_20]
MKFQYTEPKKQRTQIIFAEGTVTKTIEDTKGNVRISIGVGKSADITRRVLIRVIRKSIRVARDQKQKAVVIDANDLHFPAIREIDDQELGRLLAENILLANYEFTRYKSKKDTLYADVEAVTIRNASQALKKGMQQGEIIGKEVNNVRDLANTPGGDMTPQTLAQATREATKGTSVLVSILDKKEMQKLNMGLILGVAKGSPEEPKLIVMEYWGAGKPSAPSKNQNDSKKPIVLVGKGVTFDTGGFNLKPESGMFGMHHDMAGGASVIGAISAVAKLKLKKNVIGIVPAVENMPSGTAYRPGDVLTSMSGKTVEVINTDAEGRLILADALTYAERYSPRLVLDIATLTGASLVALGQRASAIMTRKSKIEMALREQGELSGDYVWPLPLWKEYDADIRGNVADIGNLVVQGNSRYGGAINGGIFLAQFTQKYPWAHIDMAPRMESISEDNLAKGSTGEPVRLLIRMVEHY